MRAYSEPQPSRAEAAASERMVARALVVDDDEDTADIFSHLLKLKGCNTKTAYGAQQGLELAEGFRPALICLDIRMPRMDGLAFARELRSAAGCERSYIVALTGLGYPNHKRQSAEAGIDLHVVKPTEHGTIGSLLCLSHDPDAPSAALPALDEAGREVLPSLLADAIFAADCFLDCERTDDWMLLGGLQRIRDRVAGMRRVVDAHGLANRALRDALLALQERCDA